MHIGNIPHVFVSLAFLIGLASCSDPRIGGEDYGKFPGEYAYRSSNGQVESLTVNADETYRHELYDNEAGFINHDKPLFSLDGTWSIKDDKIIIRLLDLVRISMSVRITRQPTEVIYYDLPWVPRWEGARPAVLLEDDNHYWLIKLNDRADIRSVKFRYDGPFSGNKQ